MSCVVYDTCTGYSYISSWKRGSCTCDGRYNGSICSGYGGGTKCTSDFYEDYKYGGVCNGHSGLRPSHASALNSTHPVNNKIATAEQINAIYNLLLTEITTRQLHVWYRTMSNFPSYLSKTKPLPVRSSSLQLMYTDILTKISEYSKNYDIEHVSIGALGPSTQNIDFSSNIIKANLENTLSSIFALTYCDCICYGDCASYYTCDCYGNCNYY